MMVVGLTVKEFGFSIARSFATAGFLGILGVEYPRQLAKRWADRKAGQKETLISWSRVKVASHRCEVGRAAR